MRRSMTIAALAAGAAASGAAAASAAGVAQTPPRGWRSWNLFGLHVSQALLEQIMDAMVSPARGIWDGRNLTLAQLGYNDVGLDDGWQACHAGVNGGYHAANGSPIVNTAIFPNLTAMVDYAHGKNLTAGFYSNNCYCADSNYAVQNFIGDVQFIVAAGFDGLKVDSCGAEKDVQLWSSLLQEYSPAKPVVLENCHNGPWAPQPPRKPDSPPWCPFNLYRSSLDIMLNYGAIMGNNLQTVPQYADQNLSFPGCWAYPDMLEVGGVPGLHPDEYYLTFAEQRAHFAAWAIVSSPLVLALDVRNETAVSAVWDIIANTELLDVNAAYAGASGTRVAKASTTVTFAPCGWYPNCTIPAWEVWSKPLPNGGAAVLVLNHGLASGPAASVTVEFSALPGLSPSCSTAPGCNVRDAYAHADIGKSVGNLTAASVAGHDSAFFIITP